MENNQAFEAEADIEALERVDRHLHQRSSRNGRNTMKAALGGFDTEGERNDENSPLLPPGLAEDRESEGNGDGDRRDSPTWSGERDFEGHPWWNKPSVRYPGPHTLQYQQADNRRFFGSSHPSPSLH